MSEALAQQPIPMMTWALSVREVDVLIDLRRNIDRLRRFVDEFGIRECAGLDEQVLLLDRLLGNRGATCDVPQPLPPSRRPD